MKIKLDLLMEQIKVPAWSLEPVPSLRQERIMEMTKKKIHENRKKTCCGRFGRIGITAAVVAVMLCATGFAAYELGWFGFDRIFGEEISLVEDYVVVVDPEAENADPDVVAQEATYTEEEMSMIEQGIWDVPLQAELSDTGVVATTDNYRYTLEEMVASEDTFMAILKVEALNEEAKPRMEIEIFKGADEFFAVYAINNSGKNGDEKELANGGLDCKILEIKDGVGYYLIYNNGGQFAAGDSMLFFDMFEGNLFEVTIPKIMETNVYVEVDAQGFDSISITPISMEFGGFDGSYFEYVTVTLKNGTVFEHTYDENGFVPEDYGTYGFLSVSGSLSPEDGYGVRSMLFSKLIDPEQVEKVSVNGIDYFMK